MNKRLENINKLSEEERYEYFVRQVVQFEQIWAISVNGDYILFELHDGKTVFPVWSDEESAMEFMFEEHKNIGAVPDKISIDGFMSACIPDMINDNVYFGVFYNLDRESIIIDGASLLKDIEDEYGEIW